MNDDGFFTRSEALLGSDALAQLRAAHVLVVGIGGVGSWCAEALVRTGLGHITLVDDDAVAPSNVNRQCPATSATIGRSKVEAMAERLKAINPAVDVIARAERFPCPIDWTRYTAAVDAIDSVAAKADLILAAEAAGVPLVSSMGAALRFDPTRVRISRFDRVSGDGLARALRTRFRKLARFPKRLTCVWSDEPPLPRSERGSLMTVTATFGMFLAAKILGISGMRTRQRPPESPASHPAAN